MTGQRVLKFGGAALADGAAVRRAVEIVAKESRRPVVVVSAHEGVTDQLLTAARAAQVGTVEIGAIRLRHKSLLAELGLDAELCDRYFSELLTLLERVRSAGRLEPAEQDYALSFGERMSARIVARALRQSGLEATPIDAYDLGLLSDSNFGEARPLVDSLGNVARSLAEVPGIAVVTGFLAKDRSGNLTTLGRNGSDLSAALLAEAIGASELVFWKAVPGIMTADPALVPTAQALPCLSFAEAAEFAFHGARVLHGAALGPAVRAGIPVRVGDVHAPSRPGTLLVAKRAAAGPLAIATRPALALLSLLLPDPEQRASEHRRLFEAIEREGGRLSLIANEGGSVGALLEANSSTERVAAALGERARLEPGLALVAVVGEGIGGEASMAARALQVLESCGLSPSRSWLGTSLTSQAFLIRSNELARAAQALHEALLAGRLVSA